MKASLLLLSSCVTIIFVTLLHVTTSQEDEFIDLDALFGPPSPRSGKMFHDLVVYDNYQVDDHYVTTEDGYILALYHIHRNASCSNIEPIPVVAMHGLYLSGVDFIIPGPGKAHCYLLSDAGYDIWVGNVRGNTYSRNHTTLNPDTDPSFWDFDFETMARRDLPAIIDYVLLQTGQTQIHYIGHSQGITLLIQLCSFIEKYNNIVARAIGLSPAAILTHSRLITLPLQAAIGIANLLVGYRGEIFKYGGITQQTAATLCGSSDVSYPYCTTAIFALFGFNNFTISQETIRVAVGLNPSGTSFENFNKWGFVYLYGFNHKDLGPVNNMNTYGSLIPPPYDLSSVRLNLHLVSGPADYVAHPLDVTALMERMPNCVNCTQCTLSNPYFGHIDHIYSNLIPDILTNPIILPYLRYGTPMCV